MGSVGWLEVAAVVAIAVVNCWEAVGGRRWSGGGSHAAHESSYELLLPDST